MGKSTNQRAWDTHVATTRPDKNYGTFPSIGVWTSTGSIGTSHSYVSFTRPFPLGARILSAKLAFRTRAISQTGTTSISLRRVTERFAFGRVTWKTKPAVAGATTTVSKTGPLPDQEVWEIDITSHMQNVSDGGAWFGFQLSSSATSARWIYSENNGQGVSGPRVTIEWSDQPDEPASLHPDEAVVGTPAPALSFEYLPIDEDATMQKVHVQTSASTSFTSPSWDSGEQDWKEPTVYPGDLGYPGATVGQKVYWRVRVMDRGGWSGWSPVAEFTYRPEPGITVLTPTGTTTPIDGGDSVQVVGAITDLTPTVSWSSPGQVEYQVTVAEDRDTFSSRDWIWSSGRVASTATSLEIPEGVITRDDISYRIIVRAYDGYPRVSVANDPYTYSGARCIVKMSNDPAMQMVTNIEATNLPSSTDVRVTWSRATSADSYQIIRDGINDLGSSRRVLAGTVSQTDALQPDGTYAWIDRGAPPQTPFVYSIYPVIDGKRGEGTRSAPFTSRVDGIWLVMPTFSLMIAGSEQGDWQLPEESTAHQVVGAASPTVIRTARQGYRGTLSGTLVTEDRYQPGLTAQMKRDRFLQIKSDPQGARLVVADQNFPVRLTNLNVYPTPHPDLRYECSFEFWQTGEFWWSRL